MVDRAPPGAGNGGKSRPVALPGRVLDRAGGDRSRTLKNARRLPHAPTGRSRWQAGWERHPLVAVVRLRQRLVFCRSLLALVKAGVPVTTALADMARIRSGALRAGLRRAGDRLQAGATLAEALDQVGALVDPATRALLAGGAESGRLEQT